MNNEIYRRKVTKEEIKSQPLVEAPVYKNQKNTLEIDTATLKAEIEELFNLFGVKAKRVVMHKQGKHFKQDCIDYTLSVNGKEKALTFFQSFFTPIFENGFLVGMERNPKFLVGQSKIQLNQPVKYFENYAITLEKMKKQYFEQQQMQELINEVSALFNNEWQQTTQHTRQDAKEYKQSNEFLQTQLYALRNEIKKVQQKAEVPEKIEQLANASEKLSRTAQEWREMSTKVAKPIIVEEIKGNEVNTIQIFQKAEDWEAVHKKILAKIDSPRTLSTMCNSDDEEYKVSPPLPHYCDENCNHYAKKKGTKAQKKAQKIQQGPKTCRNKQAARLAQENEEIQEKMMNEIRLQMKNRNKSSVFSRYYKRNPLFYLHFLFNENFLRDQEIEFSLIIQTQATPQKEKQSSQNAQNKTKRGRAHRHNRDFEYIGPQRTEQASHQKKVRSPRYQTKVRQNNRFQGYIEMEKMEYRPVEKNENNA